MKYFFLRNSVKSADLFTFWIALLLSNLDCDLLLRNVKFRRIFAEYFCENNPNLWHVLPQIPAKFMNLLRFQRNISQKCINPNLWNVKFRRFPHSQKCFFCGIFCKNLLTLSFLQNLIILIFPQNLLTFLRNM